MIKIWPKSAKTDSLTQKTSKLDFGHIIQNPVPEMDVELRFDIEKSLQLENGQFAASLKFLPKFAEI